MMRADYQGTSQQFQMASMEAILGSLTSNASFDVDLRQRNAWKRIIENLKETLIDLPDPYVFMEFRIPRMGHRADAIILNGGCIFVVEYKIGSEFFGSPDIDQTHGYALDLKNFHEPSHGLPIFPILIATDAKPQPFQLEMFNDRICAPLLSNGKNLAEMVVSFSNRFGGEKIDAIGWASGRYRPTPTIIEAAQALYRNHKVEDITRSEAGAENLSTTSAYISDVIDRAKKDSAKTICFVTGVPGSGKTLAGLNIATSRTKADADEHAVFLSGNGPLVKVLRAALVRDQKLRPSPRGEISGKTSVLQFIQNIHHFRDDNLATTEAPIEKVVIFDEAQRAWNRKKTSQFMRQDRAIADFNKSEPEFLLSVMDRHKDWCTVVCLVGNGQEINTGEAGISEWIAALNSHCRNWDVHLSGTITEEPESFGVTQLPYKYFANKCLHLSTSIRSFRSESVSAFVSSIIDGQPGQAQVHRTKMDRFEFSVTRDLDTAREWLRSRRRGPERSGLLAFSNGMRLKPEGIFVKSGIDPENWFLADRADVRSSDYLEDIATEFDVQGLELDWTCVCLDANIRVSEDRKLVPYAFRGTRWQSINDSDRKRYALNAHRVLLTRARQGVIVYVPRGESRDPTRDPKWYDDLYSYLVECGIAPI